MIMSAHKKNLRGRVASTMAEARSLIWIPVLNKLTKSVMQNCYHFKWFRATHYLNPKPGIIRDYQLRSRDLKIIVEKLRKEGL